jgi:hypothetical protein
MRSKLKKLLQSVFERDVSIQERVILARKKGNAVRLLIVSYHALTLILRSSSKANLFNSFITNKEKRRVFLYIQGLSA